MNVAGDPNTVRSSLPQLFEKAFEKANQKVLLIKNHTSSADTLHFYLEEQRQVKGGIAAYSMGNDSTTLQLFYQINVPWYKPWQKFGLMVNEEKYGPSLDTAMNKLKWFMK